MVDGPLEQQLRLVLRRHPVQHLDLVFGEDVRRGRFRTTLQGEKMGELLPRRSCRSCAREQRKADPADRHCHDPLAAAAGQTVRTGVRPSPEAARVALIAIIHVNSIDLGDVLVTFAVTLVAHDRPIDTITHSQEHGAGSRYARAPARWEPFGPPQIRARQSLVLRRAEPCDAHPARGG